MKKTKDTNIVLKRIKRALALLTIANYFAFMHLLFTLFTTGTAQKIWDFITVIY